MLLNPLKSDAARGASAGLRGTVADGFAPVQQAFAANFTRTDAFREVGAALAVYHRGERIIDLWAGYADRARNRPWEADTLVNVYSTTKAITALCMAMLVDRGHLEYGARVAAYWPEFASSGKDLALVSELLSHQIGLPGFDAPTSVADLFDWDRACARLAAQAPRWVPGSKTSYHAMSFGFLAGEVFRRSAGQSLGTFLRTEIAGPLGADFHIGLPETLDHCVAEMIAPLDPPDPGPQPPPPEALAALANPVLDPEIPNLPAWRRAEIPAANGHASARGAARIYAALAEGGAELISPKGLARMVEVQSRRVDLLLGFDIHWAQGVALNTTGVFGPNPGAFGHTGWGGSFVAADPAARISIAYVCNQMGPQLVGDPRARALVDAVYGCL